MKDDDDSLYLFGGTGIIGSTKKSMYDLWKYHVPTKQWMNLVEDSVGNSNSGGNHPASRYGHCCWSHRGSDNLDYFYVFGEKVSAQEVKFFFLTCGALTSQATILSLSMAKQREITMERTQIPINRVAGMLSYSSDCFKSVLIKSFV